MREKISYLIFGVLTTIVNWIVYISFTSVLNINYNISNIVAWFGAVLFAFFTNKKYVFRSESAKRNELFKELLTFFATRLFSGIFEIAGLPLLLLIGFTYDPFGIQGGLAKAIIAVIVVILNYVFSKWIVFRK
ncbi:MAG: GtrA family protein [Lachnospiraceae bacterium]|jgi:putative flippase GtrA|nr:GtrA family protein [Lachnospiraceae bacterium]